MEDQQPDPGDVTDEAPDEAPDSPDGGDAVSQPDSPAAAPARPKWRVRRTLPAPEAPGEATAEESAADDDAVAPAKPRSGLRLAVAAAVSAVLFVGSAAFAGAALQPYLADRAVVATKQKIVRTAVDALNALWNYTPQSMDTLANRASKYLSGDLEAEYRKFIDAIAAANKQAKVTDSTEVKGAAVESLNGPEATVLVFTNTAATSELKKTIPTLKYQSHRLVMKRDHNRWVITKMPTITSLNLTPKL